MHLSQAGHASLAEEVAPQLFTYLFNTEEEAPRLRRLLGQGGGGGGRQGLGVLVGGAETPRTCIPNLTRLLCCKSGSPQWTVLHQQGPE